MAFKVKVNVKSDKIKKKVKAYKKEAMKVMAEEIKKQVLLEIENGRSPVKGQGRFVKYSDSYKAQIKMQVAFRRLKDGRFIVWEKLSNKELKQFRASKQARKENKGVGDKILDLNSVLRENNKKVRPVNLKVTGKLMKSFYSDVVRNDVKFGFTDPLFDIHNNKGAGKSKTIRRMLPTKQGETFNRSITLRIREVVNAVAKKIFG